jgi:CRISPR-associated protein Cmr1
MEKITFKLEAVTPLFIAGADQKNIKNEGLRPPSIRGLLRWWFRAIIGGMVSLSDLRKFEDEIFGSPKQKSSIRITSFVDEVPAVMKIERRRSIKTNRLESFLILKKANTPPTEFELSSGLGYLWFSISLQVGKGQRLGCYPPGTMFGLTVASPNKNTLKILLGCLWAIVHLGGLGTRMRRGAGSLKVTHISGTVPYEFVFDGTTVNEAKNFIEENLERIFEDFRGYVGDKFNPPKTPSFAVLSKSHARISIVKYESTRWEDVLSKIGSEYQRFRREIRQLTNRSIFGLPIIRDPRLRNLRHASPLFIGVTNLNGKYMARLVKFYTSIHNKFSSKIGFLKENLERFDRLLDEIEVEIPEVGY